jgi:uncharacterized membrane protein YkvA (DUF1232 family)
MSESMPQLGFAHARPIQAAASASTGEGAVHSEPDGDSPFPLPSRLGALVAGAANALFERLALKHVASFASRKTTIQQAVERIPERLQRVTNQARLAVELVDDYRAGFYRDISWSSMAFVAGALVYAVSPADVVPDAIPGLGTLDDLLVTGVALRFIRRELEAYCRFKGYDRAAYFD